MSVATAPLLFNVTAVLFETSKPPMVCVGTLVIVVATPVLNCTMSVARGVVRVGVQLAAVAQEPDIPPLQVYVAVVDEAVVAFEVGITPAVL